MLSQPYQVEIMRSRRIAARFAERADPRLDGIEHLAARHRLGPAGFPRHGIAAEQPALLREDGDRAAERGERGLGTLGTFVILEAMLPVPQFDQEQPQPWFWHDADYIMCNKDLHGVAHMASAKARAPTGTRRVVQAFLHEMAAIPDSRQQEVERAALKMLRETRAARRARIAKLAPKLRKGPHVAHHPTARPRLKLINTVADNDATETPTARAVGKS